MSDDQLLDIRKLAERWDVSIHTAKQHVRKKGVPFFQVGTNADMLINWGTVRFRVADVLQWEQESVRIFTVAAPPEPQQRAGRIYKHARIR